MDYKKTSFYFKYGYQNFMEKEQETFFTPVGLFEDQMVQLKF